MPAQAKHVVLLGDSIFDNGAYVGGAPDVAAQLRQRLPAPWRATLLAIDGDVVAGVRQDQLRRLPADASHLVVSAGGNDALGAAAILHQPATSVADAMSRLAEAQARFREAYMRMAESLAATGLPCAVCTIYDANYPDPYRRLVVAGLALFNDVITRAAFAHGFPLIDLRLICDQPSDYANPIEPSAQGGAKIADVIAALLTRGPFPPPGARSAVWT